MFYDVHVHVLNDQEHYLKKDTITILFKRLYLYSK